MTNGYVICLKDEMSAKKFKELVAKQYLDRHYMPKMETASGYPIDDVPEFMDITSTYVVYTNIRQILSIFRNMPEIIKIYDNADGQITSKIKG